MANKSILNKASISFLEKYLKYFILPKQLKYSKTGWLAYPITIKEDAPFTRTEMQIFLEKRRINSKTNQKVI